MHHPSGEATTTTHQGKRLKGFSLPPSEEAQPAHTLVLTCQGLALWKRHLCCFTTPSVGFHCSSPK